MNLTAYYYVIGFTIITVVVLALGGGLSMIFKKAAWVFMAIVGVVGFMSALIAAYWVQKTFLNNIIHGILHIHPIVGLVIFGLVFATALIVPFALIPDRYSPAISITIGLAMSLLLVVPAINAGVIPGVAGKNIKSSFATISKPLVDSARWFG